MLAAGGLVVFPTETVYGLGADATNDAACARIYAAKNRPDFNPLIVHVLDAADAGRFVEFTALGQKLIDVFWPGPLTVVLPRRTDCALSRLVSAGLDTAAIRAPSHPVGRALLAKSNLPIAAPSANRSGHLSPTHAEHAALSLPGPAAGGPQLVLDAGPCGVGLESTVVDATGSKPVILRPGGVTAERIAAVTGSVAEADPADLDQPRSPGMLARHYAPTKPLRLMAVDARPDEALLAFGPDAPAKAAGPCLNLSPGGDLIEAAANLFAMLHDLDESDAAAIAVMPVPETDLGQAINDRLRRAAEGSKEPAG